MLPEGGKVAQMAEKVRECGFVALPAGRQQADLNRTISSTLSRGGRGLLSHVLLSADHRWAGIGG